MTTPKKKQKITPEESTRFTKGFTTALKEFGAKKDGTIFDLMSVMMQNIGWAVESVKCTGSRKVSP